MCESPVNKVRRSAGEMEEFDDVFLQLITDLENEWKMHPEIDDAIKHFRKVCEYNVPFGKKNRGITVVTSFKCLVSSDKWTDENLWRARILGWCVEWLQAYFLVADDIMDHSITRRGQPCWYKNENVGLMAINDSFFLECSVYTILRKYFRDEPYYIHLLELFHEMTMNTVMGQSLDLQTAPEDVIDFSRFTIERYLAIVKWKTAFYSFYLPVALALYMAGIVEKDVHENAKTILLHMGSYFQVQDDYLDCFGDPEVIGKIGTDIEDNKCSWLVVQALTRVNTEQKQYLQANYGQFDEEKVRNVKKLYHELDLQAVYSEFEETSYEDLIKLINKLSGDLPKQMFVDFANRIYKREK